MMILDFGCGKGKHPNSIGVDIDFDSKADIIADLNHISYPFKDNSFDMVICKQIFEHLKDIKNVLKEIHRISKNRTKLIIEVPHFSCYLSYGDPEHIRTFSVFSFDKLALKLNFKILRKEITFHKTYRRYKLNILFNKFPKAYERFWAFIFPAEHLHFELEVIKE